MLYLIKACMRDLRQLTVSLLLYLINRNLLGRLAVFEDWLLEELIIGKIYQSLELCILSLN